MAQAAHQIPPAAFFVADILEAHPKADMPSMEHPLFALKPGDRASRSYGYHGVRVRVSPTGAGRATIHDKDLWLYCIGQLVAAMERGREDAGPAVRFRAHDFLRATGRGTSGRSYERLAAALDRLRGTTITTNIETQGRREQRGFGLLDSYRIVERGGDERMVAIEVTLPLWLWRSVRARRVLTLEREYFELRGALERRLYELARKHCGRQSRWRVGLAALHERSGSSDSRKKFRSRIRRLARSNPLPGYRLTFHAARDLVTFYPRGARGGQVQISDTLKAGNTETEGD